MTPRVLYLLPPSWRSLPRATFESPVYRTLIDGVDSYAPGEIDYVVVGAKPVPGLLASLPSLKLVIALGAGVDAILADPLYPRHITLIRFTDPALAIEMAQYVTQHVLAIHRGQRHFDAAQAEHRWGWRMLERPARATRIGIVGLGEIGAKIAARLGLFGFQVSGWARSAKDIAGVESYAGPKALAAFLGQCDYVVNVLPLTDETRDMMDAAFFAALPRGAYVINVARGALLVEDDLIAALDSGHLAGAVLDVFRTEPLPADSPLWDHPKITITPHVAGITDPRLALFYVGESVARHEAGEPDRDVVDIARGY